MKPARIIILVIALAAGGVAAMLAGRSDPKPPEPVKVVQAEMVDVLVAKADIAVGQSVTPGELRWQSWPVTAAAPTFIRKSAMPDAVERFTGAIARLPFVAGEPINEAKLVKAQGSGFMAAILPSGKRAISTEISAETGAGGFILPNDRVDVILTRREKDDKGDHFVSETMLNNVRVLAIDQMIAEKDGQKVVVGKTATLELTPGQAETLALSRQQGTMSLALRSLADTQRNDSENADEDRSRNRRGINTVRYGVSTTTSTK
ncbi:MAG: Flp pilus assembly protein CpaB [Rhizobiales bacterium]|nr:Flp pilus assembly protein CpaB [Hyphomicrobiales bacterium]